MLTSIYSFLHVRLNLFFLSSLTTLSNRYFLFCIYQQHKIPCVGYFVRFLSLIVLVGFLWFTFLCIGMIKKNQLILTYIIFIKKKIGIHFYKYFELLFVLFLLLLLFLIAIFIFFFCMDSNGCMSNKIIKEKNKLFSILFIRLKTLKFLCKTIYWYLYLWMYFYYYLYT